MIMGKDRLNYNISFVVDISLNLRSFKMKYDFKKPDTVS